MISPASVGGKCRRIEVIGGVNLHDRIISVVELESQRPGHHCVHEIERRDVGELQNLLITEVASQLIKYRLRNAAVLIDEVVGVGQQCAFHRRETLCDLPVGNRGDLGLVHAKTTTALAVLRVHELAGAQPPCTGLTKFAQQGVECPLRAAIQTEPGDTVGEHIGNQSKDRPPVARRAGRCPRFCDRVSITKKEVV